MAQKAPETGFSFIKFSYLLYFLYRFFVFKICCSLIWPSKSTVALMNIIAEVVCGVSSLTFNPTIYHAVSQMFEPFDLID